VANSRIVGDAEGTIIATIMTVHIGTSHASWGAPAFPRIGITIAASGDMLLPSRTTYSQASAVMKKIPATITIRS
jgi:hypothetical protein